jgi:hypothetical protein
MRLEIKRSSIMTYRYLSVKALIVIAFVAFFSSSCSSVKTLTKDEEEIRRQEVFRVAFALLQQKAAFHSIQDKVIIEIDSTYFYHNIEDTYQKSWIREILNIPVVYNSFSIKFKVSIRNQPYLTNIDNVRLNDYQGFIAAQFDPSGKKTVFDLITFGKEIENYNHPFHLMHVDTAIARTRLILGLSDTIQCIAATLFDSANVPSSEIYCHVCARFSQQIWHLQFLLESPETTYFYQQRYHGKTPQEILKEIPIRNKRGWDMRDPVEALLKVNIDCETGEICSVDVSDEGSRRQFGLYSSNPNLQPFLDRVDSICKSKFRYYRRQKWKE